VVFCLCRDTRSNAVPPASVKLISRMKGSSTAMLQS
jgi:hypothetical protein